MLKRMLSRKIFVVLASLFAFLLLYLIPDSVSDNLLTDLPQELEYVNSEVITDTIYLLDSDNYLGQTMVVTNINNDDIEKKAKELINVLIQGGEGENQIPSGFKSILPSETKIISVKYEDGLIKINFSEDLLDISKELEEKMIEAIVYTLTSIDGIDKVIIYVEDDILSKLPQTKINLPATLDRSFGINKEYDITSSKDINQVTIYYINKYNDDYYYVPVTKYVNDTRDKISIIVDELSSSYSSSTNLMSFLNSNAKLLAVEQIDNALQLEFNSYIFNDQIENQILEEVIYTISLSVADNYDVDEVIFTVDNQEIYKSVIKTIE
ncbi:MAG: GerMN domain-containing protein [Bacilli bacterium]|nr:GerMN domain-containing protein [Bacilli bacterium]